LHQGKTILIQDTQEPRVFSGVQFQVG